MSAVSANIDVSDSRLLKYSSSRFTLESFLIGRFSSTLLSEVLYRTRYFPLHSTLTLVPIDFEVNSCLTLIVVCLSLHPKKKNESKEKNQTKLSPNFYSNSKFILSRKKDRA